jgi:hypothetical protein
MFFRYAPAWLYKTAFPCTHLPSPMSYQFLMRQQDVCRIFASAVRQAQSGKTFHVYL